MGNKRLTHSGKGDRRTRALYWVLAVLLVGAPLLVGGRPLWARQVIFAGAALVFLLSVPRLNARRGGLMGLALLGLVAYGLFQLTPMPAGWLARLSPETSLLRSQAGLSPDGPLSLDLEGTAFTLLQCAACAFVFYAVVSLEDPLKSASRVVDLLIVCGVVQACYGIAAYYTVGNNIWGWKNFYHPDRIAGTYVNPNNFGGLMAILVPLALGRAGAIAWPRLPGGSIVVRVAYLLDQGKTHRKILFLCAATLMTAALILSGSRGATAALIAGVAAYGVMSMFGRRASVVGVVASIGIFSVLLGLFIYGLGSRLLQQRMMTLPEGLASRITIWTGAARIVESFPIFGTGLGSYAAVHMAHHPTPLPTQIVRHAHADVLQIPAEIGLPLFLLLLGAALLLGVRGAQCLRLARRANMTPIVAGLLASGVALLVRSLVDFDLQMAGSAVVVSAIAGVLCLLVNDGKGGGRALCVAVALAGLVALAVAPRQYGQQTLDRLWVRLMELNSRLEWDARQAALRDFGTDAGPFVDMSRLALQREHRVRIRHLRKDLLVANDLRVAQAPADGLAHANLARRLVLQKGPPERVRRHGMRALRLANMSKIIAVRGAIAVLEAYPDDPTIRAWLMRTALTDRQLAVKVMHEGVPLGLGLELARTLPPTPRYLGLLARVAHHEGDQYTLVAALERLRRPQPESHMLRARVRLSGPYSRGVAAFTVKTADRGTQVVGLAVVDHTSREYTFPSPPGTPGVYVATRLYRDLNLKPREGVAIEVLEAMTIEPR